MNKPPVKMCVCGMYTAKFLKKPRLMSGVFYLFLFYKLLVFFYVYGIVIIAAHKGAAPITKNSKGAAEKY